MFVSCRPTLVVALAVALLALHCPAGASLPTYTDCM